MRFSESAEPLHLVAAVDYGQALAELGGTDVLGAFGERDQGLQRQLHHCLATEGGSQKDERA